MKTLAQTLIFTLAIAGGMLPVMGQQIQDMSFADARSGGVLSLSSQAGNNGLAVVFMTNYCPYAKLYEGRMVSLAADLKAEGINVVLVNPHTGTDAARESLEQMKAKVDVAGYTFPYLADVEQALAKALGATKTPEAFLLKAAGEGFEVVYSGAIDDNPQVAADVHQRYLLQAAKAHAAGQAAGGTQRPTGCTIRH